MATAWQRLRPWWFTGLGLGVASLSDRLLVVGILVWVGLAIAAAAVALGTLRGTHRAPAMPPPAPARRRLDQVVLLVLLLAAVTVGTLGGAPMFEAREYGAGPPVPVTLSPWLVPALAALLALLIIRAGARPTPWRLAQLAAALYVAFPLLVLASAYTRLVTHATFTLTPLRPWALPGYELASAVLLLGAVVLTARARLDGAAAWSTAPAHVLAPARTHAP